MLPVVRAMTTGRVRVKARDRGVRRYAPGGWSDRTLPVNVYAVSHPSGVCLFDTGQTARAARPGHLPRWHPFLRLARFELDSRDEAAGQLARHGIAPSDVRWIVLSHLHTDHMGGVGAFPTAEVIVSHTEWETASGLRGRLRGYLPHHWPAGLHPRLVEPAQATVGPLRVASDLAADGSLLVVALPGHTPGHLGLLVRGARTWLCVGDHVRDPAELRAVDPDLHAWCRQQDATILAAHDDGAVVTRQQAEAVR